MFVSLQNSGHQNGHFKTGDLVATSTHHSCRRRRRCPLTSAWPPATSPRTAPTTRTTTRRASASWRAGWCTRPTQGTRTRPSSSPASCLLIGSTEIGLLGTFAIKPFCRNFVWMVDAWFEAFEELWRTSLLWGNSRFTWPLQRHLFRRFSRSQLW